MQVSSMRWTTAWKSVQLGPSVRQAERLGKEGKWEVWWPGNLKLKRKDPEATLHWDVDLADVLCRVSGHQAAKWLKGSIQIERAAAQVKQASDTSVFTDVS